MARRITNYAFDCCGTETGICCLRSLIAAFSLSGKRERTEPHAQIASGQCLLGCICQRPCVFDPLGASAAFSAKFVSNILANSRAFSS